MIDRFLYWGNHVEAKSGKIKGSFQPPPPPWCGEQVHEAHSRQNSSVQDVTQAVSRTIYVMDMKQRAGVFFHDSQFFLYPLEILKLLFFSISESFCMSEG